MTRLRWLLLGVLWALSIGVAAYAASQQQISHFGKDPILSGDDIGFRVEGHQGAARTGTLMVKIDGKWVEARSSVRVVPVK